MSTSAVSPSLRITIVVLATASMVIVATEFIVVGLLPAIALDLRISTAAAGHLVSAFALSASLLGPPLTLIAAGQPPRRVLVATLLLFATTNLLGTVSPGFQEVLVLRILQGAALPVFLGVSAAAVVELAPPKKRGWALGLVNTGFAVGVVIAMPVGVALAEVGGWTSSFVVLASAAFAAAVLAAWLLPSTGAGNATGGGSLGLLRSVSFHLHLALSVAMFGAMFTAYTYIGAWLQQVARLSASGTALALMGFGIAGIVGNMAAASVADRIPLRATLVAAAAIAVAATGLSLTDQALTRVAFFIIWGMAHTAAVILCQIRVTLAGRSAPAFAAALNISAANLGIALGAVLGGWIVTRWGIGAIGWGAACMLPLVVVLVSMLGMHRH